MNILFLSLTILSVFLFYFHTIFYGVKLFDEITPFKETYLPVCFSLNEMFELISKLGLNQHFEATNTLYSNIVSLRCNPFGTFHTLLAQFVFKKNPVSYHLYSLILHLINTGLVFLIINSTGTKFTILPLMRLLTALVFSFLWAVHPANIESVLLLTNYNTLLSYTLCFLTVYIYFNKIFNLKASGLGLYISAFILYLFALFTAEFHFMLPVVILSYSLAYGNNLLKSLKVTSPLFIAAILFVLFFSISNTGINLKSQGSFQLIIERILWLAPQIYFHFFKLVLFPLKLSIDQPLLVNLGKSLLDPYSLFCILFLLVILALSLISLLRSKKAFPFIYVIFIPAIISLSPFSQIFAPLYNMASERYLYLPTFLFIFGISHFVFYITSKINTKRAYILLLVVGLITSIYSIRAFVRTLDWKDSFSLYYSAIQATDNPLNKAFRYKGLTPQDKIYARFPEHFVDPKYLKLAYENLEIALKNLEADKTKYQHKIPKIIKFYGLDPESLISKAGYYLSQTDFTLNKDYKRALDIITPYTTDLTKFDSAALSFYGALLFYNQLPDKAESILRKALQITPYSTKIIFPLCDLIQINNKDSSEIEKLMLKAVYYFPYDTYTLYRLTKFYRQKSNLKAFAYYSYIYGLRHHSIQDLISAERVYLHLGNKESSRMVREGIKRLEK